MTEILCAHDFPTIDFLLKSFQIQIDNFKKLFSFEKNYSKDSLCMHKVIKHFRFILIMNTAMFPCFSEINQPEMVYKNP